MELEGIVCPTLIITGYEAFTKGGGQVGLETLQDEISTNFPDVFNGIFHYNSAYGDWRERLVQRLKEMGFLT